MVEMKPRRRITVTGGARDRIDPRALAELLITLDELRTQTRTSDTDPAPEDDPHDQQPEDPGPR